MDKQIETPTKIVDRRLHMRMNAQLKRDLELLVRARFGDNFSQAVRRAVADAADKIRIARIRVWPEEENEKR